MKNPEGQRIALEGQKLSQDLADARQEYRGNSVDENRPGWKTIDRFRMEPVLEVIDKQKEILGQAVNALGSEFHEDWRKTRLDDEGNFKPRIKETKDTAWIEANGTDQVDIANTTFDQLPEDWKAENEAAANVVVGIMVERDGQIDLSDEATRNEVGGIIHDAWLSRNDWAAGGDLDKPFDQLPADEQAKDISQVEVAQRVFDVS